MKLFILGTICLGMILGQASFAVGPNSRAVKGMEKMAAHASAKGQEKRAAGIAKAIENKTNADARKAAGQAHRPASSAQ